MNKILIIGSFGFIGAALAQALAPKHYVLMNDVGNYGFPPEIRHIDCLVEDFDALSAELIAEFDTVILLAGFSAVATCTDLQSTLNVNVTKFARLLGKLKPSHNFIYASSGSVYGFNPSVNTEYHQLNYPINYYDMSKQMIDMIAKITPNINYKALRFGTVCGISPNMRNDVLLNKMTHTAIESGVIRVSNGASIKSVLGMNDLIRAVEALIKSPSKPKGFYNLSSVTMSIRKFADLIAERHNCEVIDDLSSGNGYSIDMSTAKFEEAFNFEFLDTADSLIEDLATVDWSKSKGR